MLRRLVLAAALLAVLPGCTAICRGIGLCSRFEDFDELKLPPTPPQDFQVILQVYDQADPPADYLVIVRRDGSGEYRVVRRHPSRRETHGKLTLLENQIQAIYGAVLQANYGELPERIPEYEEGEQRHLGARTFSVTTDGYQKEVVVAYAPFQPLDHVARLVLDTLPGQAMDDAQPKGPEAANTAQVIGDTQTRRFYAPDSPLLADVPENRRQSFPSYFMALDYGYEPGSDWRPPAPKSGN
jgi:hypothetical protein